MKQWSLSVSAAAVWSTKVSRACWLPRLGFRLIVIYEFLQFPADGQDLIAGGLVPAHSDRVAVVDGVRVRDATRGASL